MTIEERARKAYPEASVTNLYLNEHQKACRNAYIRGAIDQQKIDIDKACKWLNAHADDYIFEQYDIIRMEDNFVAEFRKAMEED